MAASQPHQPVPTESADNRGSITKVLVDLNVILDVLESRHPHYEQAARLWAVIERGHLLGFVAAHSFTTLHYLLSQSLTSEQAQAAIRDVLAVFSVAPVTEQVLRDALALGWKDFEDAVQMSAAAHCGASVVVTRNPSDFKAGPIRILTPAETPALIASAVPSDSEG